MQLIIALNLIAGFAIGHGAPGRPVAPAPREKPLLKCEVRLVGKHTVTSSTGELWVFEAPDIVDVVVTNISGADVDIGYFCGPAMRLDFRVKDPSGADVKTESFLKYLSTYDGPKSYILKPGESYQALTSMLRGVPEEKRVKGTYKVKAVYTVAEKKYESDWVEITWPWKEKIKITRPGKEK